MSLFRSNLYAAFTPTDFSKSRKQMLLIESVRVGFLFAILLLVIAFQSSQPEFVNLEVLLPVYATVFTALLAHTIYIFFFDLSLRYGLFKAFIFAFDAVVITLLIYHTGISYSIFLFLYLVNIILCGLVFQKNGALLLASWTSVFFSFLLMIEPGLEGQTLYFSLGLNNISFFVVGYLAGHLSEQLNFMGSALTKQTRGMRVLQDMHRSIVENVGSGMITISSEGEIFHCNPEGEKILALSNQDLEGENVDAVLPEINGFIKRQEWEPGISHRLEFDLQNADGDELTVEVVVSPIWRSDLKDVASQGAIEGFILLFQDMTKIRRLEFSMRQSEKLAAVGQLAAGIAHEIRNPLASISGSIQMLETMDASDLERGRLMKIVLREIDRLNGLITEFLDFVRPDKPATEVMDLQHLVGEVMDMLQVNDRLNQNVEQVRNLSPVKKIKGEPSKLKQALLNIMINAYQALDKVDEAKMSVSLREEGEKAVLSICDNGCGMKEIDKKKIFEPFHTTKPKGTGLGMAITHKIIEAHEAQIFVKSEVGVGTEFTIEFKMIEQVGGMPANNVNMRGSTG